MTKREKALEYLRDQMRREMLFAVDMHWWGARERAQRILDVVVKDLDLIY